MLYFGKFKLTNKKTNYEKNYSKIINDNDINDIVCMYYGRT